MFEGPEKKFQRHIADLLIKEHSYTVLEQEDIIDSEYYFAEDSFISFVRATQKENFKTLEKNYGSDAPDERIKALKKELLAILLGKGTQKQDVLSLAGKMIPVIDKKGLRLKTDDLIKFEGVGNAKAAIILSALEFARRRIKPEGFKINTPADILPHIKHYADRKQEHFLCASINGANEVINIRVVSIGLVNKTQVHPREVFADPLIDRASAIIVAHNHPSGGLTPSDEDLEVTKRLKDAGETLGIRLLDHIIFNHKGYYSFLEKGELMKI